ncbi:hypothetical protein DPSP01_010486 [Paraphaeosphaeria sporulosa]|uniref:Antigenic cell wall galactomanno protein n=1 Tax=Paraphaeosphaeria sporulosa TaxID=1460663 RepID=A0A177BXP3_9PLEO|nr:uncharacterized protein CC84DRAFT_1199541 [Paraphaeosphaeria sporulosa]OAF99895.1 hypothetical protein CC84DRAFT_1199541 [Paraphaeosphaeria sporulosa]
MRFTPVLSLLPFALALPRIPRDAASLAPQVLEQIATLNSSLTSLTTAVNAFDGTLLHVIPQSLAVITAETALDAATLKTTFITKSSGNFTQTESNSVVAGLANLIAPIQTSLTALSAKYEVFKKTLESPIVLLDLKILKAHTDDLIDAVTAKVVPASAGLLGFGKGIIDKAFDDAIAVYQGS